ncbi:ATP-binding cassette sub-family C member 4 [Tribolium castaneum]|uniref:Putative multidrug resistance-associated protein lethal(2)03659-like Protein n=1 Tax=Tribolium castaneum TaxID=7070 RepID=D6WLS5_TRICA|nr:PREDICTED: probable multidrug resistance-associated protein lethal(2)03659 [Tribolium castaneum]EFA04157.2 putative multidrug resistance-associated protein lethal(2)03659-like Protein [Tribolium castaneum]|eukprot:XP_008193834.1 PREDICTED: probable multidrug resistance-associated protein lethal(2)03659 [Tribolium castaneum]
MDSSKKYDRPSPEETANPLSKLFFAWTLPFFKYGYSNDLQLKDLYNCAKYDLSGKLGDDIERNWLLEVKSSLKNNKKPSLLRTIRQTFITPYSLTGVILCLQCAVLKMFQPIVLAWYINYYGVNYNDRSSGTGWGLATGVILLAFVNIMIIHHCNLYSQRIGMRSRIATCSLIYRKLLRLNRTSLGQVAVGKLVNLLSNDVQRFDITSTFLHYIWIMPIQAIIAFYVMYRSVGLAALSGLGAITLQAVFLQGYLSRLQGIYRMQIAQKTDNRVKLMNEITAGIQVIKMYAWEKPFEKVVALARKYEINIVAKTSYIRGFSIALMVFTERTASYLTLITFVLMGNVLSADVVFSVAQLFNTVQLYMCILYPLGISTFAEAKTSVKRIEEFLLLEENETGADLSVTQSEKNGSIRLDKVNASWTPNPIVHTLMDLNIEINPGTLCCVVGPVGAGKSSLLQLLLKELPANSGRVSLTGNISYASQEPWLFVSSVRNNILFGQQYLKNRYKDVVKVCALETDFEQFPHGDKTLVGERGTSLSGGQRARVNLARAVYRDADIYLFDDPLSAVDAHVGKHLFNECIVKYLKDKTRVLVTHQLQFLRQADLIIVLNNGQVEKIGTFAELSENELNNLKLEQPEEVATKEQEMQQRQRLMSIASHNSTVPDDDDEIEAQETEELMEKGAIPTSTYLDYYRSGGSIAVLLFLVVLLIIAQASCNASDLWLTYWTNLEQKSPAIVNGDSNTTEMPFSGTNDTNTEPPTELNTTEIISTALPPVFNLTDPNEPLSRATYIWVYSILILFSIILTTSRSLLFFKICMNASRRLHNLMFSNVLQAPMRFFDTNPSGRILNRFSKDMGAMDELLPRATIEAIQIFLVMSGILLMVFIVTPWMIAVAVVLGGLFYWFRVIYLATAQDVKRLEGITRAPVFSHVSASLYGLPTIRAASAQNMIIKEFDLLQDQHTGSWFMFIASSEAFGLYLDIISTVFLAIVTYQFLIFDDGTTKRGNVGLVISQSLILTGMLQYGVRQTAEVASNMTSVERILQYTKLDKEGPFESLPTKKPSRDWPQQGRVVFKNVYLRYIPNDPPVLKNLSFEIQPGEKVGIVGRTGAGKSSLISALFRLTKIEGAIEIDGVNTQFIGLNDLRSNISIIPQEPVLFSNTVRYNLDPFEKCDDKTLWKALENVELKNAIDSLDQRVSEGGSNFSAGQRQLVCLARAIVRNNKVLVLDEATANVDPATDALIQTSIRKNFKECTVLTIAHRLNTIMDSDKVLVMDAGEAVEFDHPHRLLQNQEGRFSRMLRETGKNLETQLKEVAKNDYENKFGPISTSDEQNDNKEE